MAILKRAVLNESELELADQEQTGVSVRNRMDET